MTSIVVEKSGLLPYVILYLNGAFILDRDLPSKCGSLLGAHNGLGSFDTILYAFF